MMSITDMLARLRADAASEQFEGARLGPIAVRELLRHVDSLVAEAAELSEQVAFTARHLAIISGVLGSPEPIEIDDIAARLHLLIAERDELSELVSARAVIEQCRPAPAAAPVLAAEWTPAPVDPTPAMIAAAESVNWHNGDTRGSAIDMWHRMLAAAPDHLEGARGMP